MTGDLYMPVRLNNCELPLSIVISIELQLDIICFRTVLIVHMLFTNIDNSSHLFNLQ